MWVPGPDGVDITEVESLGECEPKTCVEDGELKYIICNPTTQVVSRIPISTFEQSKAEYISKVLRDIKLSTCKDDKLALKPIQERPMNILELERVNNIGRVKDYPKRITIFVLSRKSSLSFEAVQNMESMTFRRMLLQRLEDPEPVNTLEVEARDLVKLRISRLEERKQGKKDESSKQSKSSSTKKASNQVTPKRKSRGKKK